MADRTQNQLALLRSTVEQFLQDTADPDAALAAQRMLAVLNPPRIEVDSEGSRFITLQGEPVYQVSAYKEQESFTGDLEWFVKVNRIGQPWFQKLNHPSSVVGYPSLVTTAILAAFKDAREKGLYPR